jgi:predicted glycoside hydrolase/deacetylase ChbG (UPF0249 family)
MTREKARGLFSLRAEKSSGRAFHFTLCADDFALSPAVSRGILEALDAGRLSATSVITTRPSWAEGARELRGFAGRADLGLHVNLTLGSPLGPMPAFAPSGTLPDVAQVLRRALAGALPEREIRDEIARQIDRFIEAFGAPPDFVDGHQHVQVFPHIRTWLLDALDERGLAGQVWLRDSGDRVSRILARRIEPGKAFFIALLARGFARQARLGGYPTNDGFAGFSRFDPDRDYAADFASYLRAPGRRHLVMCHPGYCDAELEAVDEVTATRQKELAFLVSSQFVEMLERRKFRLTRFRNI